MIQFDSMNVENSLKSQFEGRRAQSKAPSTSTTSQTPKTPQSQSQGWSLSLEQIPKACGDIDVHLKNLMQEYSSNKQFCKWVHGKVLPYLPDVLLWFPSEHGCHLKCPTCAKTLKVRDTLVSVRVVDIDRCYWIISETFECCQLLKGVDADIVGQMPLEAKITFPAFVFRHLGLSMNIVEILKAISADGVHALLKSAHTRRYESIKSAHVAENLVFSDFDDVAGYSGFIPSAKNILIVYCHNLQQYQLVDVTPVKVKQTARRKSPLVKASTAKVPALNMSPAPRENGPVASLPSPAPTPRKETVPEKKTPIKETQKAVTPKPVNEKAPVPKKVVATARPGQLSSFRGKIRKKQLEERLKVSRRGQHSDDEQIQAERMRSLEKKLVDLNDAELSPLKFKKRKILCDASSVSAPSSPGELDLESSLDTSKKTRRLVRNCPQLTEVSEVPGAGGDTLFEAPSADAWDALELTTGSLSPPSGSSDTTEVIPVENAGFHSLDSMETESSASQEIIYTMNFGSGSDEDMMGSSTPATITRPTVTTQTKKPLAMPTYKRISGQVTFERLPLNIMKRLALFLPNADMYNLRLASKAFSKILFIHCCPRTYEYSVDRVRESIPLMNEIRRMGGSIYSNSGKPYLSVGDHMHTDLVRVLLDFDGRVFPVRNYDTGSYSRLDPACHVQALTFKHFEYEEFVEGYLNFVDLSKIKEIEHSTEIPVFEFLLKKFPEVESFTWTCNTANNFKLGDTLNGIFGWNNLKSLKLRNMTLKRSSISILGDLIRTHATFTELILESNQLADPEFCALFQDPNTLANLSNLTVVSNYLSDNGVFDFIETMRNMYRLRRIDFSKNYISPAGKDKLTTAAAELRGFCVVLCNHQHEFVEEVVPEVSGQESPDLAWNQAEDASPAEDGWAMTDKPETADTWEDAPAPPKHDARPAAQRTQMKAPFDSWSAGSDDLGDGGNEDANGWGSSPSKGQAWCDPVELGDVDQPVTGDWGSSTAPANNSSGDWGSSAAPAKSNSGAWGSGSASANNSGPGKPRRDSRSDGFRDQNGRPDRQSMNQDEYSMDFFDRRPRGGKFNRDEQQRPFERRDKVFKNNFRGQRDFNGPPQNRRDDDGGFRRPGPQPRHNRDERPMRPQQRRYDSMEIVEDDLGPKYDQDWKSRRSNSRKFDRHAEQNTPISYDHEEPEGTVEENDPWAINNRAPSRSRNPPQQKAQEVVQVSSDDQVSQEEGWASAGSNHKPFGKAWTSGWE